MSNLIERFKNSIELAEKEGENMDDVSWGMQEGILISYNEAKKVINAFEALQIVEKQSGMTWDSKAGSDFEVGCMLHIIREAIKGGVGT